MSDLILQIAVSLDGYIEDVRGSIDFMDGDTSLDACTPRPCTQFDGTIFGRRAHALLVALWPTAGDTHGAGAARIENIACAGGVIDQPRLTVVGGLVTRLVGPFIVQREDAVPERLPPHAGASLGGPGKVNTMRGIGDRDPWNG